MKKINGFTLIELLATVLILSILLFIAVPQVQRIINNSREDAFHLNESLAVKGARKYMSAEFVSFPPTNAEDLIVSYSDLVGGNHIEPIFDPKSGVECTDSSIVITKQNANKYTYAPNLICENYASSDFAYTPVDVNYTADTEKPVISILGGNPVSFDFGTSYIEYGAVASDNSDTGAWLLANMVIDSSNVDTNTVGSYTVTYNVSDSAGNSADEVTRTVNVLVPPIRFADTNPADGGTVSGSPTFEIEYLKENAETLIITINGTDYYIFGSGAGTASDKILKTCKEIKLARTGAGNGVYWIRPENSTFRVYCDMGNGGRMLLDNFTHAGFALGTYGYAIGGEDINSTTALTNAGWARSIAYTTNYQIVTTYAQMYAGGTGYIQKVLPSYANKIYFTWGNWYTAGDPDYAKIDGVIVSSAPANTPGKGYSGSYSEGDILRFEESNGVIWINIIWVWENESNLIYATIDADVDTIDYIFSQLNTGSNTYSATITYTDASSYSTEERTITKN